MVVFPNAKINLGLYITEKRKDGYHNIETCMFPIPLCDALEMVPAKKFVFDQSGIQIPGDPKDNLIVKAYHILRKEFNDLPPVHIHLHKAIPTGAGLGGGSSDAAFALKLMNKLFELYLEDWFLAEYAEKLGSDCSFFIENKPMIAKGRGEILSPVAIDLKGNFLVLIKPPIHISTQAAYSGVTPKKPNCDLQEVILNPTAWKEVLKNDFEESLFPKYPELSQIKAQLYDAEAWYASLSGSGATVFGLFKDAPEAKDWGKDYFVYSCEL